jgi:hypothetical protein
MIKWIKSIDWILLILYIVLIIFSSIVLYQIFFFLRCQYSDFLCYMIPDIHKELKRWIQSDLIKKILNPYRFKIYYTKVVRPEKMWSIKDYIINSKINKFLKFILVIHCRKDIPVDYIFYALKLSIYKMYDSYFEFIILTYFCLVPFLIYKRIYIIIFLYIKNNYIYSFVYKRLNNKIQIYYLKKRNLLIQQQLDMLEFIIRKNIPYWRIEPFFKKRQKQIENSNRYFLIIIVWWDELKTTFKYWINYVFV